MACPSSTRSGKAWLYSSRSGSGSRASLLEPSTEPIRTTSVFFGRSMALSKGSAKSPTLNVLARELALDEALRRAKFEASPTSPQMLCHACFLPSRSASLQNWSTCRRTSSRPFGWSCNGAARSGRSGRVGLSFCPSLSLSPCSASCLGRLSSQDLKPSGQTDEPCPFVEYVRASSNGWRSRGAT